MSHDNSEWWRWELNRKIAEFLSRPTQEQEATLGFMLTSYRALHDNKESEHITTRDMP